MKTYLVVAAMMPLYALDGDAQNEDFLVISKNYEYIQRDAGFPTLDRDELDTVSGFVAFGYDVEDAELSAGTILNPNGISRPFLSEAGAPVLLSELGFVNPYQLDQAMPFGVYQFDLPLIEGGRFKESLSLATMALPSVARLKNQRTFDSFDPAKPFVVTWDPLEFPEGVEAIMSFSVSGFGDDGGEREFCLEPDELSPEATEVVIPANTFLPDDHVFGTLSTGIVLDGEFFSDRVAFAGKDVEFEMRAASLAPDTVRPTVVSKSPSGFEDVSPRSSVRIEFSEPMATSIALIFGPPWDKTPLTHHWNANRTVLHCRFTEGFPPDTNLSYQLNPPGAATSFQDLAGNTLASVTGFFTTTADVGGGPDVDRVGILLGSKFLQEIGKEPIAIGEPFVRIVAYASGEDTLYEGAVVTPSGARLPLQRSEDRAYHDVVGEFVDIADLRAMMPMGNYQIDLVTATDGNRRLVVPLDESAFQTPPPAKVSANPSTISQNGGVVSWEPPEGSDAQDWVQLVLYDHRGALVYASPDFGDPGALSGTGPQVTVNGAGLRPGRQYHAELLVSQSNLTTSASYPDVSHGVVSASVLRFVVETSGTAKRAEIRALRGVPGELLLDIEVRGETNITHLVETSSDLRRWEAFEEIRFDEAGEVEMFGFESSERKQFLRVNEGELTPDE